MSLVEKQDYVFYQSGTLINSKQPMKNADVCVVSTKDYVFFVPKKTIGIFPMVTTIKTHRLFENCSIEDGVKKVIDAAEDKDSLEKSLIALLEDDDKYVHPLSEKKSFKFKGILGKHTLRMSTGGANWSSVSPNGKGNSKEFRAFHGQ